MYSTFRAIATDKVKVGNSQWLGTAWRLWIGTEFIDIIGESGAMPDEDRDTTAVETTIEKLFNHHGITTWLDAAVVAITVDGASVLLSVLCDKFKKKAPTAMPVYCAPHRTQRVDADVTQVQKADHSDTNAMTVRKGAMRLDNMLSCTAKFFNVSTKRWAGLRRTANTMGYHIGVRRWKRSAGNPPHFGTHGGWRLPLDIHSGCKYVVYGVCLWWKQGVLLPGCLI